MKNDVAIEIMDGITLYEIICSHTSSESAR